MATQTKTEAELIATGYSRVSLSILRAQVWEKWSDGDLADELLYDATTNELFDLPDVDLVGGNAEALYALSGSLDDRELYNGMVDALESGGSMTTAQADAARRPLPLIIRDRARAV
jgi:hypothetical protein